MRKPFFGKCMKQNHRSELGYCVVCLLPRSNLSSCFIRKLLTDSLSPGPVLSYLVRNIEDRFLLAEVHL